MHPLILKINRNEYLAYQHCFEQVADGEDRFACDFYRSTCIKLIVEYIEQIPYELGRSVERYSGRSYQVIQDKESFCIHLPFSQSEQTLVEKHLPRFSTIDPELRLANLFRKAAAFHGLVPIETMTAFPDIESAAQRAEFFSDYAAYLVTAVKDAHLDVFMRCPPTPMVV